MIVNVNFEELLALRAGAEAVLQDGFQEPVAVAAPPEDRARVRALPPLEGDLSVYTYAELRALERGVETITGALREEMDAHILTAHPAAEGAVVSYFDYAHALSVLGRIREMGQEMVALVGVVTGQEMDEHLARTFIFPD